MWALFFNRYFSLHTISCNKLKRVLITKTNEKFKLLITFFFDVLAFILIYKYFPIISSPNQFLKSSITLLKLSLSIIGMALVFYFFIYYRLIEKRIITETFWSPLESFFLRHKKIVIYIFLIIGLYRIADIVMGVVANLFYSDLGYSLVEIASHSKFWRLITTFLEAL